MIFIRDALLPLGAGDKRGIVLFFLPFRQMAHHRHPVCPRVISAAKPLCEARQHHTFQEADQPRSEAHMNEKDKKRKEAEQHLTQELANQARQEPGSAAEAESKEKRAQAEKELQDVK
jgi:hypothetical protein